MPAMVQQDAGVFLSSANVAALLLLLVCVERERGIASRHFPHPGL